MGVIVGSSAYHQGQGMLHCLATGGECKHKLCVLPEVRWSQVSVSVPPDGGLYPNPWRAGGTSEKRGSLALRRPRTWVLAPWESQVKLDTVEELRMNRHHPPSNSVTLRPKGERGWGQEASALWFGYGRCEQVYGSSRSGLLAANVGLTQHV